MPDRPAGGPERAGRLTRADYSAGPESLAPALLGCVLVRVLADGRRLSGRITETEAYLGVPDRAAHAFGGRRTARVEPMYGPAGLAYVYFTYGMHFCFNVVCGQPGEPVAVLVRSLTPVEGLESMRSHRASRRGPGGRPVAARRSGPPADSELCRGPANLCRALAIDGDFSGADLTTDTRLWIEPGELTPLERAAVDRTPRIGVDYAQEWAEKPLRWLVGPTGEA